MLTAAPPHTTAGSVARMGADDPASSTDSHAGDGRPTILAHRGASAHASDNTIAAFQLAVDHGADGVECDVRLTADDVIVMHHDPVIPGMGVLGGYPFAAIRQRHPQIPTLDETLAALPNPRFVLNIEIKNDPDEPGFDPHDRLATQIAEWIGRHGIQQRTLVTSFNRAAIDRVRADDETITTGLLVGHQRFTPMLPGLAADGHRWILPHHSRLLFAARRHIRRSHDAGLLVGTWTLDTPWRLRQVRTARVDAVIANDPGAALRALERGT